MLQTLAVSLCFLCHYLVLKFLPCFLVTKTDLFCYFVGETMYAIRYPGGEKSIACVPDGRIITRAR